MALGMAKYFKAKSRGNGPRGLKGFVWMEGGGVVAKAEGEPDAAPARVEAREERRAAE